MDVHISTGPGLCSEERRVLMACPTQPKLTKVRHLSSLLTQLTQQSTKDRGLITFPEANKPRLTTDMNSLIPQNQVAAWPLWRPEPCTGYDYLGESWHIYDKSTDYTNNVAA